MQNRFLIVVTLSAMFFSGWPADAQVQQETVFRFAIGLPNGAKPELTIREGDVGSVQIQEGTFSFKPTRDNFEVRVEVLNGNADGGVLVDVVTFTKDALTVKTTTSPSLELTLLTVAARKRGA